MTGWLRDTLSKRLLLLMWAALVASHLAAFLVVRAVHLPPPGAPAARPALPTLPSLPPTPGVPGEGMHAQPPPSLPLAALLLDYGVRFAVIALFSWFGSRWLAAPMGRLAQASATLGGALRGAAALPALDERSGTHEVRDAARVFNTMAAELREQFRSRGLMVAAISHDLRTPLTRLRMRLESDVAGAEAQQRSVADIHEMNALIDNVLEVFRLEGSARDEPLQATDVDALVHALVDDLAEQGQPVSYHGCAAVTAAQPAALRRVVANLVANALRYGERADVRVQQGVHELRITVDDSGPGIPAAELAAVFEPFHRLEASRNRHTGGTGLGLYIARDLAQRQGGRLLLANRAEGGLRAELTLPRR